MTFLSLDEYSGGRLMIGPAYDAVVEAASGTGCFQFVTEASAQPVKAVVYGSDGETRVPAGEHVTLYAVDYDLDTRKSAVVGKIDGFTDAKGELSARLNIGACSGVGIKGPIRMNVPSNRRDYWHITYVPGAHVVALLDDVRSKAVISPFQHVCEERYEAYRKPRS
jgi:hypothetical protein